MPMIIPRVRSISTPIAHGEHGDPTCWEFNESEQSPKEDRSWEPINVLVVNSALSQAQKPNGICSRNTLMPGSHSVCRIPRCRRLDLRPLPIRRSDDLLGGLEKSWRIGNVVRGLGLIGVFIGLMAAAGDLLGGRPGILRGLGLGLIAVCGAWWFSDRIVIRFSGARILGEHAAYELNAMLEDLADRAAIRVPLLYVVACPQPNSFAVGPTPRRATIVVTDGLLSLMEPAEIRAVLAHELTHISRRDTQASSIAGATASVIFSVGVLARRLVRRPGSESPDGSQDPNASITAVPAGLARFARSSKRECAADCGGSSLTGDPEALAKALMRIHGYTQVVPMPMKLACASAWLVDPLGARIEGGSRKSSRLSVGDRVACLRAISSERVAT
jgi:heat shock protein HtpX